MYIYISVYTHKHTCTHTCTATLMYMLLHACTYLHAYTLCRLTYTHIHTYIHARMHACILTYTHAYVHTYIHTYIHTYVHTYIHTCIHTYITSMHAYIQTCTHAYIHTYIHCMHTHAFMPSSPCILAESKNALEDAREKYFIEEPLLWFSFDMTSTEPLIHRKFVSMSQSHMTCPCVCFLLGFLGLVGWLLVFAYVCAVNLPFPSVVCLPDRLASR